MSNIYTVIVKAEVFSNNKWYDVEVPLAYTSETVNHGNPKPYADALKRLRAEGFDGEVICYNTTPYKRHSMIEVQGNG